jgi:hypothetical protein
VFGVRFPPGGFRPFLGGPVSAITRRFLPIGVVFGLGGTELETTVPAVGSAEEMVALVEQFLSAVGPEPDPTVDRRPDGRRDGDAQLLCVDELARPWRRGSDACNASSPSPWTRAPRWVICRHRMQDAAAKAGAGRVACARLAADVGDSGQAHSSRDFAANVGVASS